MPKGVDEGFIKADSTNLPAISVFMVWEFLVSDYKYNAPEVRGVKVTQSSGENYGDSAIGYVCLKRESPLCTVRGSMCPQQRVRGKDYKVELVCNEREEKIISLKCFDCPAQEGGCKHGISFLMWCNRRFESPSPTEIECYWKKSRLSSVGADIKFITAVEMSSNDDNQCNVNFGDNSKFLSEVMERAQTEQLDSQLSRHFFTSQQRVVQILSMHQLIFQFCLQNSGDFIGFANRLMTIDLCKKIEEMTRDQKNNVLWHEMRFGRITASVIHEASRCKKKDGSLVRRIIGVSKVYDNIFMERGRTLEEIVIEKLKEDLNVKIEKSGLILVPEYPMIGASPDGIGNNFVVEVKCPSSEKNVTSYIRNDDISEKCKGQINLQMFAAGVRKGLFCVADPKFEETKKYKKVWIDYDEKFTLNMIEKAKIFWEANILSTLMKSLSN